jgi:hypothetical protein
LVFKVLLTIQEPARLRNGEWRGDLQWWIGNDIEWNRSWLNLSNFRDLCAGTEENREKLDCRFADEKLIGDPGKYSEDDR